MAGGPGGRRTYPGAGLLASYPRQLFGDVEERGDTQGNRRRPRDVSGAVTGLPSHLGKVPGVGAREPGHRKRPAAIVTPVGERFEEGVPDPWAEAMAVTGLVFGAVV